MPLASWLFIKGTESIWVERPHGHTMIVAGPGPVRKKHRLSNETELQAFQTTLAEELVGAGWFLWGFDRERRTGGDRRTGGRAGSDRRASARAVRSTGGRRRAAQ